MGAQLNKALAALRDKIGRRLHVLEDRVDHGDSAKPKWRRGIGEYRARRSAPRGELEKNWMINILCVYLCRRVLP